MTSQHRVSLHHTVLVGWLERSGDRGGLHFLFVVAVVPTEDGVADLASRALLQFPQSRKLRPCLFTGGVEQLHQGGVSPKVSYLLSPPLRLLDPSGSCPSCARSPFRPPSLYPNTSTSFLSSPLRARFLCWSSSLFHSSLIRSFILPHLLLDSLLIPPRPSTLLPLLPLFPLASDSSPPASSAPSSLSLIPFPLPLDADITSLPGGGLRPSPRGAQLEAE
ncbi:hypothetical protein B0H14DRAFT_3465072 [Mycena olivaceomarginata]|nr:hypothetical protein B0H14DRAFT_3465072 [Mycena olivaceomarginata]